MLNLLLQLTGFLTKANTVFPIFGHWTAWTQTLDLQFKYLEQTVKQFTFSCKSTTSALSIWCTFCSEAITSDSGILNLNNWAGLEIAMPRIRLTCCCTGLQKQHFAKKNFATKHFQNRMKIFWRLMSSSHANVAHISPFLSSKGIWSFVTPSVTICNEQLSEKYRNRHGLLMEGPGAILDIYPSRSYLVLTIT